MAALKSSGRAKPDAVAGTSKVNGLVEHARSERPGWGGDAKRTDGRTVSGRNEENESLVDGIVGPTVERENDGRW